MSGSETGSEADVGGGGGGAGRGEQLSRHIRVENKMFHFACKRNQQGRYIKVDEVKGNYRNSILVPESGWDSFREVFEDCMKD